jgi:hypothetical protein
MTNEGNIYKEDYIQACKLISKNYIYLEKKLNKTREEFLEESMNHAQTVDWSKGKSQFINQIRKLRAKFNDGHFSWSLGDDLCTNEYPKFLGFVLTIGADERVYVEKVYPNFTDKISEGYEIVKWNGKDIGEEIERIGKVNPQSTKYATDEIAARRLIFELSNQPLIEDMKPVTITYKDEKGIICDVTLNWKDCKATVSKEKYNKLKDKYEDIILLTRSLMPSLEEIPEDVKYIHPSLLYYSREMNSKKYTILHPRDFFYWKMEDLDNTFKEIVNEKPDVLVVDLKDSAGGAFNQVLFLSNILNVQKEFKFFYDKIHEETGLRLTGNDNFNFITDKINLNNVWKGDVIFRINPLTCSGGDFFARWMQLSNRGIIIGRPSAGAGGGTDGFTLDNTKTTIQFPLRERIIIGDDKSIEGNSVIPNTIYYGDLIDFLKEHGKEISDNDTGNISNEGHTIDQLCDGVLSNNIELVNKIIASSSVDINQKDSKGFYPIGMVLPMNNCEMAIILLDAGVNPHVVPRISDTKGKTVYDYVMSEESDCSKYFKNIFKEHSKYKK